MRYYKLMENAYSCKNPLVLKIVPEENGFSSYDIYFESNLNCTSINATSYYDGKFEIEDYISCDIGFDIVTEKAKNIIEQLSIGNTAFIPINVIDRPDLNESLYAMHIKNHLDADVVNYDMCKCIGNSVAVYGFYEHKIQGNDLFRVKGDHIFSRFVSQNFVQAVKKNKLKGFAFSDAGAE